MTGRHRFRVWPWVVSVVLVATMLVLLAVNGVLTTPSGADAVGRPVGAMDRVPVQVPEGGSVLDATHSPVRSLVYPARTVALTFDDGPDPQLDAADPRRCYAGTTSGTFFVLGWQGRPLSGSRSRGHPGEGSQVGCTPSPTPTSCRAARRGSPASYSETPDRPRGGHRGDPLPAAAAVLVGGRRQSDDRAAAGSRRVGQARLRHRPVRRGQPRTGHRPGVDAIVATATPRTDAGGGGAAARRRRRPRADGRGPRPAHPAN